MTLDPFFRRMTMIAGIFAFISVILGVIALATNYWTMGTVGSPGMPMQTSNGTVMVNEKVDWTWNVSFKLFQKKQISSTEFFIVKGTILHVYIT